MATHVTVELPQVIEAAGLPVVRPCHSIEYQALLIFCYHCLAGFQTAIDFRTQYGWSWRSHFVPSLKNKTISVRICVFAHNQSFRMRMGQKGIQWISTRRYYRRSQQVRCNRIDLKIKGTSSHLD